MLEYKNRIKYSRTEQLFKYVKLLNIGGQKWEAHNEGREYLESNVPEEFEKLSNEIPF